MVRLTIDHKHWITLEIEDDGRGFNLNHPYGKIKKGNKGLGLISMRERAERVGGQFWVESIERQGTRVFAKFPLKHG